MSSGIGASASAPTMARYDDDQFSLSTRVDVVEGRLGSLEATMDIMVQELKKISLKFDDRNLADGTY